MEIIKATGARRSLCWLRFLNVAICVDYLSLKYCEKLLWDNPLSLQQMPKRISRWPLTVNVSFQFLDWLLNCFVLCWIQFLEAISYSGPEAETLNALSRTVAVTYLWIIAIVPKLQVLFVKTIQVFASKVFSSIHDLRLTLKLLIGVRGVTWWALFTTLTPSTNSKCFCSLFTAEVFMIPTSLFMIIKLCVVFPSPCPSPSSWKLNIDAFISAGYWVNFLLWFAILISPGNSFFSLLHNWSSSTR